MAQDLTYTPLDEINEIHATLNAAFRSGKLKSIEYRKYQLLQLGYMLKDNDKRFEAALSADLGRPVVEAQFLEIGSSISDVKKAYSSVDKWSQPEKPPFSFNWFAMRPVIYKEPKGVVLVIVPFNYPIWLAIGPMASAIASGNALVVKPSESAPAVAALLAELVPKYLDPDLVRVVNGGVDEATKLLSLRWDHILYTGSSQVGRIVAVAAAKHLTPVTLELGGKCPVFIDPNCDLKMAARRILWGKTVTAGQTCTAPDYVLVPREFQESFVQALSSANESFFPEHAKVSEPGIFCRMVTPRAFTRVNGLLKATRGTIVFGGETDEATKYIAPTVVKDVTGDDSLMSEEIFGPILAIVPVDSLDEAIAFVNARDHPLALYVFSQDAKYKEKVFSNTQSGGAIANEVVIHCAADGLPFGGVGGSGYGAHTGKTGFDMFTHHRSSIDSPAWLDMILGFRFPPYTKSSLKRSTAMFSALPPRPTRPPGPGARSTLKWWRKWFLFALALGVAGRLTKRLKVLRG